MLLSAGSEQSERNKKELFISLGCLAVDNYTQLILNYNQQLTSELKRVLTLLVNNLQICSQLKNRILNLQDKIKATEEKLAKLTEEEAQRKDLLQHKEGLEQSLTCKEDKLSQLNQENLSFLLKTGKKFYQVRLWEDKEEFNQIYNQLDWKSNNQELNQDSDEVTVEDLPINQFNLNSLLSV